MNVKAESPFLERGFVVADTPGLASINPAHRRATLSFLPTADAVLYLIDTQQPFTEGDASFLGIIRRHIDSIFIVQTKIDLWQQPQSDGRPAWEHAYERIAGLAAMHAPGTYVTRFPRASTPKAILEGAKRQDRTEPFPEFLAALDAPAHPAHRPRAHRARARTRGVCGRRRDRANRTRPRNARARPRGARAAAAARSCPSSKRSTRRRAQRDALLAEPACDPRGDARTRAATRCRARTRARASFRHRRRHALRDRERLHIIVDRVVAHVAQEFAEEAAARGLARARRAIGTRRAIAPLRFAKNDAAARAFDAEPATGLWSGDVRDAIAATIVLEAIGGPAIALVADIATRFAAARPAST